MNLFVLTSKETFNSTPDMIVCMIANYNGDYLYAVDGNANLVQEMNPTARDYYEADWEQNAFPLAPGDTPLEKYLNGINNMYAPNSPNWTAILPAIAQNENLFNKFLNTTESNAFASLQTVVIYRNLALFQSLALRVISGIPGGLSPQELDELNTILNSCNFPGV